MEKAWKENPEINLKWCGSDQRGRNWFPITATPVLLGNLQAGQESENSYPATQGLAAPRHGGSISRGMFVIIGWKEKGPSFPCQGGFC